MSAAWRGDGEEQSVPLSGLRGGGLALVGGGMRGARREEQRGGLPAGIRAAERGPGGVGDLLHVVAPALSGQALTDAASRVCQVAGPEASRRDGFCAAFACGFYGKEAVAAVRGASGTRRRGAPGREASSERRVGTAGAAGGSGLLGAPVDGRNKLRCLRIGGMPLVAGWLHVAEQQA